MRNQKKYSPFIRSLHNHLQFIFVAVCGLLNKKHSYEKVYKMQKLIIPPMYIAEQIRYSRPLIRVVK